MSSFTRRLLEMQHLNRIVGDPYGVNILGLLEVFASIGALASVAYLPRLLAVFSFPLGFVGVIAFDLWWRNRQPEQSPWVRMLSPFTGGCFMYVPIWLIQSVAFIALVIFAIVKLA